MSKRIVVYLTNWSIYARQFYPWNLNLNSITHVNYAFFNINANGEIEFTDKWADTDIRWLDKGDSWNDPPGFVYGIINQLFKLKKQHRHLKTLMSVGGWTLSKNFSTIARTAESRRKFVASAIKLMLDYGFDGVDLDWEYPSVDTGMGNVIHPDDGKNYTLLLQEFRTQFAAIPGGRRWLLTIAAPAGQDKYRFLEIDKISQLCDFINLMTYDYEGSWSPKTGHQSNLYADNNGVYNTDKCVTDFINAGAMPSKLVLGFPLYGRGWTGVAGQNNGFGQSFTGLSAGSWERGVYDYKDIMRKLVPAGYQILWDDRAKQSYLWHPSKAEFVSFDDPMTVKVKAEYVNQRGLGGLMTWEASGDTEISSADNLINVARSTLNGFDNSMNILHFPTSPWNNINNVPADPTTTTVAPTPTPTTTPTPTLPPTNPTATPTPTPTPTFTTTTTLPTVTSTTTRPTNTTTTVVPTTTSTTVLPTTTNTGIPTVPSHNCPWSNLKYITFENVRIDGKIEFVYKDE